MIVVFQHKGQDFQATLESGEQAVTPDGAVYEFLRFPMGEQEIFKIKDMKSVQKNLKPAEPC